MGIFFEILFALWLIGGAIGGIINAVNVLTEQDGKVYMWNVIIGIITFHVTSIVLLGWSGYYLFKRSKMKDFFQKEVADLGDKEKRNRRSAW